MINNRKARFEYNILEEFLAGVVLVGSEVKSIRDGRANINDAYCILINNEMFIRNMHVDPYEEACVQHEVRRDRKLLLQKKELKKISNWMIDKGLTIVPLNVSVEKKVKIKIGIAKGKKLYDKRQSIKDREIKRDLDRDFKQ